MRRAHILHFCSDDKILSKNFNLLISVHYVRYAYSVVILKPISYSYDDKKRGDRYRGMNVSISVHGNYGARERELRSEVLDVIDIQLL